MDTGDTAWILVCAAMVMLMTPGLGLFYAGMARRKNVLGTIMQSFVALGIITIQWALFGYSLAFGPDIGHLIGGLKYFALSGVGMEPNADYAATIPHQLFMVFQMMFAIITPALISGAIAERIKFKTYLVFITLWAILVYNPLAHWVWGVGGWIREMGALDFAGGLVVHISSGVSALAAALVLGKRKGYGTELMAPHNLTMTIIGAGLLWFGWFGFNGGSALASGSLAASAFVATHIASGAGALSWMVVEWIHRGKPTALGIASGAVAGLVAITPACGFVGPMSSIIIGLAGGAVCYLAVSLKPKFGYDDSLDVVGVHAVGGTLGALMTGLFASTLVNPAGGDGLFFGNAAQLGTQALSVVAAWVYSFVVTWVILKILDATMGLRVSEEEESEGLDLSQHGESGYVL
ncbi:MAG: ammonium transporter [Syntrophobacteraceae bacterium]|nr:ammonium transporter [Syntrophobacteraceae bacterium]MCU0589368.1 ammonium transporter [Syntrophobacteraceae bacterium]